MIIYAKAFWGVGTLGRWYGSAFPRALPFSLFAATLAGLLQAFTDNKLRDEFLNPYPFTAFAFIVGFMIVFRSNLSYGRYWEGRTQLQQMSTKLTDVVSQAISFDRFTLPNASEPSAESWAGHTAFRDTIMHLASLLHGVALATLRDDYNMENIIMHNSLKSAPPTNAHGKLVGEDDVQGGTSDGKDNGKAPSLAAEKSIENFRSLDTSSVSFHDYFVLRTDYSHARSLHGFMKLPVIAGFTQAEGTALGAITTSGDKLATLPAVNLAAHGTQLDDGTYTPAPYERVHTIVSWIQQVVLERVNDGGLGVPPPIRGRVHVDLAAAMGAYEHCRKIVDTPFPFPWAQAVTIVLIIFTLAAPVLFVAYLTSVTTSVLMTFAAVHTYVMLNEVARDVEDPFHYDPNELPLPQLQYRFNERLLAVAKPRRPIAFTDFADLHGPGNTPQIAPGMSPTKGADGLAASRPATTGPPPMPALSEADMLSYSARNEASLTSAAARWIAAGKATAPTQAPAAPPSKAKSAFVRAAAASLAQQRAASPSASSPAPSPLSTLNEAVVPTPMFNSTGSPAVVSKAPAETEPAEDKTPDADAGQRAEALLNQAFMRKANAAFNMSPQTHSSTPTDQATSSGDVVVDAMPSPHASASLALGASQ